jgi:predicted transcriptional regulator
MKEMGEMRVRELTESLKATVITGQAGLDKDANGAYVCDLLSWVMSHANKGNVWITVQTHLNIVAVALLTEISCIIVPEGIKVEEETIIKAVEEGIPILSSSLNSYELSFRIYDLIK